MVASIIHDARARPVPGLEQVLEPDNLRAAWREVRTNHGAPGADGISLDRFEQRLELNLARLAEGVRAGSYQPGPVRHVSVVIRSKARLLAILTVADRVLQRAALNVLEPFFDRGFLPRSYGYRPGRSVTDAIDRVIALRDRGFRWVVDADIQDCFPCLDHAILQALLDRRIQDPPLRDLLHRWIAMDGRLVHGRRRGVSLGAVISPLFCNVYLHPLDRALARAHLESVRYADDFIILCTDAAERQFAADLAGKQLRALRLALSPRKTRLTSFDEGFTFLGIRFRDNQCLLDLAGRHLSFAAIPAEWTSVFPSAYSW